MSYATITQNVAAFQAEAASSDVRNKLWCFTELKGI